MMTDSQSKTRSAVAFDFSLAPDELAVDDMFSILSNQRRRYVLQSLGESQTPVAFDDLVDDVAEQEHDAPISDIPAEAVDRVRLSLYHSHIPKLADVDLVEHCEEREQVSLSTDSEQVEALLEFAAGNE